MKVISIIQPWATLIAVGEKKFETRSWATKHRGPLAIHAGKKIYKDLCEQEPFKSVLAKHGYTADNLPTGVVVAICNLEECWSISRCLRGYVVLEKNGNEDRMEDPIGKNEEAFGWYEDGRIAWQLKDVKQLETPIPAKGQQRIWNWGGKP